MFWPRLGALVLVVLASATSAALATGGKQPLVVTSSLDGKKVLPQMTRWLAHPNVAPADVAEVSFRIDGKVRWVEHSSPYNYASDDEKGHLGYLFTTWLKPGLHRFTVVVKAKQGQKASDVVTARVLAAPAAPASLLGTWTRELTTSDSAKADPKYGSDNVPPSGKWRLAIDQIGVWELDPLGSGIVQAYTVSGDVLRSYAPIQMVPRQASGDPGSINRFGSQIDAGGGIDCDESGPFGTYCWSVANDQLTLSPIRELCGQRRAVYEGVWTRVG